jgi:hypothetical protein
MARQVAASDGTKFRTIDTRSPRMHYWWEDTDKKDEYTLAREIFETLLTIEQDQKDRRERNMRCMRLYNNLDFVNIGPYGYSKTYTSPNLPENRVKYNIITSCVDTLCAKVSKMKPKVSFLTGGGEFHIQQRAKKLQKFSIGTFYHNDIYVKHQQAFRDSLIFDIGAIKHFHIDGQLMSERVMPMELYVDIADGMYGTPRSLYHVKYVHKEMLAAQYEDFKQAIKESTGTLDVSADRSVLSQDRDYVVVVESWHLPSKDGADDGRHCISVEKACFLVEDYKRNSFPFSFFRWSQPLLGFYGQSLTDRLTGNQIEINKMLRVIQRSFHLGSAFKVFLEYGSKVARDHINNEVGSIVYYAGAKPEFYVPKVVNAEYFQHLEWLIKSAYEESGISQLSAASKLPPGLDGGSGKALREYNDLETERFVLTAQQYESSFLETAKQYIELAREMKEEGIDLTVTAESKKFVETIKWSEIDLENDQYIMQMFPVSSLPNTPSGRLAYIQELAQAGYIPQEMVLSLLEFPDVEGYTSLKTAPLDNLMDTLDKILYEGKYMPPEPFQNLQLGTQIFQQAYLRAKINGAPEDRLELVQLWISSAQDMLTAAAQAAQAAQPSPGPSGPGSPAPGVAPTPGVTPNLPMQPNPFPPQQ